MNFDVRRIDYDKWLEVASQAYLISFGDARPIELEKFHFAIAAFDPKGTISGWITCHEMDSETLYFQFGGVLPTYEESIYIYPGYKQMVEWTQGKYKRVITKIENKNLGMLKLALKVGFLIVGTTTFKGKILVDLLLEH